MKKRVLFLVLCVQLVSHVKMISVATIWAAVPGEISTSDVKSKHAHYYESDILLGGPVVRDVNGRKLLYALVSSIMFTSGVYIIGQSQTCLQSAPSTIPHSVIQGVDYQRGSFFRTIVGPPSRALRKREISYDLVGNLRKELQAPLSAFSINQLQLLKNRHVIFLPGLGNELTTDCECFAASVRAIEKDLGATASVVRTSSFSNLQNCTDDIAMKIRKEYAERGKSIVIVGHSRGGIIGLSVLFHNVDLVLDGIIEQVILINSPVKGSKIAEFCRKAVPIFQLPFFFAEGIHSISPEAIQSSLRELPDVALRQLAARYPETSQVELEALLEKIIQRVYFVRSFKKDELNPKLMVFRLLLYPGLKGLAENDGVVGVDEQRDENLGYTLGSPVEGFDHLDTEGSISEQDPREKRYRAFVRAILAATCPIE